MYKNDNMYIIEMEDIALENIRQAFYRGAEIVFFTDKKVFRGGGDKGRY